MTPEQIEGQRTAVALIGCIHRGEGADWQRLLATTDEEHWPDMLAALTSIGVLYVEQTARISGLDPEDVLDMMAGHALHAGG